MSGKITVTDNAQAGAFGIPGSDTIAIPTQRLILLELQVISYLLHSMQATIPEDLSQIRNSLLEGFVTYGSFTNPT